ncbi:hypothetical protein PF004_g12007 [Phytophthora fragariae]|uniref:Uncharacterized protein n=1 Tax=Phytophthora fragariae TaxID=53985 RepID=A0A6G0NWG8_9STRA|nr:hypothetical protein PF004_g12007 [Phytophthora fragariae]
MPSVGLCVSCLAFSTSMTVKVKASESMAVWYLRAKFCSVPVMKPCGKKKTFS